MGFLMRGIPYLFGGQNNAGLDCSGFIVQLLRRLGYAVDDMTAQDLMDNIFTLNSVGDERGTIAVVALVVNGDVNHIELALDVDRKIVIGASEDVGSVEIRTWPYPIQDTVLAYADMSYLIARLRRGEPTTDS